MRLFTGVFPPEAVQRDVRGLLDDAPGPPVRWIAPANLHFTMVFLGEVDAARLTQLRASVDAACEGRGPFEVELAGLGGFPDLRRPRVLWLGCREGGEAMEQLHDALTSALPADLRPQPGRAFRPHLTLARLKRPVAARELDALAEATRRASWRFQVSQLVLVESRLRPSGAVYEPLHRGALRP